MTWCNCHLDTRHAGWAVCSKCSNTTPWPRPGEYWTCRTCGTNLRLHPDLEAQLGRNEEPPVMLRLIEFDGHRFREVVK
jgi:hypothetical protein